MVENTGISFGINFPGMVVAEILALVIVGVFVIKNKNSLGWWLLLLGGGLNLGERLFFGKVTDYWPIFSTGIYNNINDHLIFIGLIVVIWEKWKKSK
jgi:lipoprotein signal peptidase